MEVGSQISWKTISGSATGIVERVRFDNCLVRLANGKQVIVNSKSIISNGKTQDN